MRIELYKTKSNVLVCAERKVCYREMQKVGSERIYRVSPNYI